MSDRRQLDARSGALLLGGCVLVVAVALIANGNLLAVIGALLAVPILIGLVRAPLEAAAAVVLLTALTVDDVKARPYMAMWTSPVTGVGRLVYDGLEKSLGIPGFKLYGVELLILGLLVNLLLRLRLDRAAFASGPTVWAGGVAMAVVLWLEVWGIARGGNVRFSMLQMRPMLLTGLTLVLFHAAFSGRAAVPRLLGVICVAAWLRALLALYFWAAILPAKAAGDELAAGGGAYISTHGDTVLWVVALWVGLALLVEAPGWRSVAINLVLQPPLLAAIVGNNRRVASITLVVGTLMAYLVSDRRIQRRTWRMALAAAPVLLLYVAVAWHSGGTWAKPVQALRSVVVSEDRSSGMRDIENYNLIRTARSNAVIGSGLGHEYEEEVRAISISDLLEAYRYMPHNSLLWLAGAGGVAGVIGFLMFLPVGVFLAVRLYDESPHRMDRIAAMTAVGAVVAYGTQCFADIGMQSWSTILVTTGLLGAVGARAGAVGAWPAGVRG